MVVPLKPREEQSKFCKKKKKKENLMAAQI